MTTVPRRRGRPPRTEAQRADQRARLLAAAKATIRAGGPDVPVEEMAAAAGVSKPVLYDEFGGRLGVADAVAVSLAEQVQLTVAAELATAGGFDIDTVVRRIVGALVSVIEDEPELYAFLVRSIRSSDRRFLDNALVRVVHDQGSMLISLIAPGTTPAALDVLTSGLFGFVFAAVEAWVETKEPDRETLVELLSEIIRTGIQTVAAHPR